VFLGAYVPAPIFFQHTRGVGLIPVCALRATTPNVLVLQESNPSTDIQHSSRTPHATRSSALSQSQKCADNTGLLADRTTLISLPPSRPAMNPTPTPTSFIDADPANTTGNYEQARAYIWLSMLARSSSAFLCNSPLCNFASAQTVPTIDQETTNVCGFGR
jgi:hypothetical protein